MNRLALKALFFFVFMSGLMGAATSYFLVTQVERLIKEQTVSFARSSTEAAHEQFNRLPDTTPRTLTDFFENQLSLVQLLRLRLVDTRGRVLGSKNYVGGGLPLRSDVPNVMPLDPLLEGMLDHPPDPELHFQLSHVIGEENDVIQADAAAWEDASAPLKTAVWVTQRGINVGILEMEFSLREAVALRARARDRFWLVLIVWGMVFTLAQVLLLTKWILVPVNHLMHVAGRIAGGDEDTRATVLGTDEMADMGRSLNHMADSLAERKELLAGQNRELLAKDALVQQELRLARVVQNSLLRGGVTDIGGLQCLGRILQMNEVGGDLFELIPTPDGGVLAAVGDVSGKGVPAALVMVLVMSELRDVVRRTQRPGEILTELNQRLHDRIGAEDIAYVTMFLAHFAPATNTLAYARAAHPYALLLHDGGNPTAEFLTAKGLPLGIESGVTYGEKTTTLAPGDRLLLYTDGVFDAWGRDANLDEEALRDMALQAAHSPGLDLVNHLFTRLCEEGGDRKDDLTLVGLHLPPAS